MRTALVALALLGAACSEDPVPEPTRFVEASGEYAVEYLDPPWRIRTMMPLVLDVPSNAETFLGVVDAGPEVPPKYVFEVSVVASAPRAAVDADVAAAGSRGEVVRVPARATRNAQGIEGFEYIGFRESVYPRFVRYVYFAHPSGSLRILVDASPDLDDNPEIADMLRKVEVRPGAR